MGPATVIREDATLREAANLMLEQQVQGLLVVDAQGEVRGVLTERQLTLDERYLRMACCTVPRVHGQSVTRLEEIEAACVAAGVVHVAEVMETRLTSASVGEGLGTVVERMLHREAEFGIVRDGSSVVGMLGGHDLLRRIAGESPREQAVVNSRVAAAAIRIGANHARWSVVNWLMGAWR